MPLAGSGYNQDGRSSGLTAPNGPAQTALVRTTMAAAGCRPDSVCLVTMHGTGTPLGDPIEVNALGQAMAGGAPHRMALGEKRGTFLALILPCDNLHINKQLIHFEKLLNSTCSVF